MRSTPCCLRVKILAMDLTCNHFTKDKHSSLLWRSVSDEERKKMIKLMVGSRKVLVTVNGALRDPERTPCRQTRRSHRQAANPGPPRTLQPRPRTRNPARTVAGAVAAAAERPTARSRTQERDKGSEFFFLRIF